MVNFGQIITTYEAISEIKLQDFVEVSDNLFDSGNSITGLGNKKPKSSHKIQRRKLLDRIEKENEDTRREVRKGNIQIISFILDSIRLQIYSVQVFQPYVYDSIF